MTHSDVIVGHVITSVKLHREAPVILILVFQFDALKGSMTLCF